MIGASGNSVIFLMILNKWQSFIRIFNTKRQAYEIYGTLYCSAPRQTNWAPWSGEEPPRNRSSPHWHWLAFRGLAIFWRLALVRQCCQLLSPPGETRREGTDRDTRGRNSSYSDSGIEPSRVVAALICTCAAVRVRTYRNRLGGQVFDILRKLWLLSAHY